MEDYLWFVRVRADSLSRVAYKPWYVRLVTHSGWLFQMIKKAAQLCYSEQTSGFRLIAMWSLEKAVCEKKVQVSDEKTGPALAKLTDDNDQHWQWQFLRTGPDISCRSGQTTTACDLGEPILASCSRSLDRNSDDLVSNVGLPRSSDPVMDKSSSRHVVTGKMQFVNYRFKVWMVENLVDCQGVGVELEGWIRPEQSGKFGCIN